MNDRPLIDDVPLEPTDGGSIVRTTVSVSGALKLSPEAIEQARKLSENQVPPTFELSFEVEPKKIDPADADAALRLFMAANKRPPSFSATPSRPMNKGKARAKRKAQRAARKANRRARG